MQVGPGDRVTIHGLKSKPELNGQSAVLVGQAAGGRVTVRLDSGQEIALKQENLGIQAPGGAGGAGGMPGAGGGMPGFGGGGMPGFGGGMPGMGAGGMPGMPDLDRAKAMAAQAAAALQKFLDDAGIRLPPGVSIMQAAGFAGFAALGGLYILSRFTSMYVFMLVGAAAYWGTVTEGGKRMLKTGSAKASSVLRRPVPKWAPLCVLCLAVGILGHMLLARGLGLGGARSSGTSGGSAGGSAQDAAFAQAIREAYDQGYDDGVAGDKRRPPKHIPFPVDPDKEDAKPARGKSSGFGLSSLMKYGMVGYSLFKLGNTPTGWNLQVAITNAKTNPLQVVMMLVLLSGMLI
mmetsp:Transcript_85004/g.140752  ORF Transcript_85004/g.140752 Transcript_85004/m.140752 type:complete len:347 (+) Transcript_85004:62-1102(+)